MPLDKEYLFFGGIQHSPVYGGSATSCNFGVLTGEAECPSFYIPNAIKRGSGQKRHEIYPLITLVKWNKHMIHFILVPTFRERMVGLQAMERERSKRDISVYNCYSVHLNSLFSKYIIYSWI